MSRLIAWAGGGVFVASLALCAWWYFVRLGDPLPRGGSTAVVANALLVTIFACHHSVFARDGIKRRLSIVPPSMMRSLYVWIASALFIAVVLLWQPIGGTIYDAPRPLSWLHAAVQVLGI